MSPFFSLSFVRAFGDDSATLLRCSYDIVQRLRDVVTTLLRCCYDAERRGGVYFVFLRQEGFRQPPRKHFVIHGKSMGNRSMENPWKIEWEIHGKPWTIHGKFHGKSMENHEQSMDRKNGKKEMFPWYSMGPEPN